jgi:hypothetical protein
MATMIDDSRALKSSGANRAGTCMGVSQCVMKVNARAQGACGNNRTQSQPAPYRPMA